MVFELHKIFDKVMRILFSKGCLNGRKYAIFFKNSLGVLFSLQLSDLGVHIEGVDAPLCPLLYVSEITGDHGEGIGKRICKWST